MVVSSLGCLSSFRKTLFFFFFLVIIYPIIGNGVHYRHEVKAELISKPMRNWHRRLVLFIETHDIKLNGKEERAEYSFI